MAVTLTTNWQNIANSSFVPGTGLSVTFYLDAKYSTQSTTNNTTTIQTRLNCVINSGYGSGYNYSFSCSYSPTKSGSGLWTLETETITSGEGTITHNQDGTKTITLSASARINGIGMNISFSGEAKLPDIARYPMIITAPDFSDEDNPTLTYTTSLGFPGSTIEAGIFDSTGNTAYASYRQITLEDGSYTFNLTNTERTALRNATPNSNTLNVMYKIRTTTNSQVFTSTSIKQMRIVNANPTFTYTTEEINSSVIALLGSSANTVIQNASIVRVVTTPTTYKGTTVDGVMVTSEGFRSVDEESPYSADVPIKDNRIRILVADMRGNSTDTVITKTMIEYQPVDITSLSMKRVNPTSSNIILNLEAKYYQKTFGTTANAPTIKWKLGNGNYTTIPSSAYTIDTTNNKVKITNYTMQNVLPYTDDGQFTLYIEDLLTNDTEGGQNGYVIKGIPTYDAGEHDFKVNGTLYIADQNGENKVDVSEMNKVSITTDDSAVKTGRTIDGYDEYVKRITLDSFASSGTEKTYQTGIEPTNLVVVGFKAIAISNSGNWFSIPNVNVAEARAQVNADGTFRLTMFQGNFDNGSGYVEIYYYHTS